MKTIPEIVNYFNDDKAYILAEKNQFFSFADMKRQMDWTEDFFIKNQIHKKDVIAIVLENGPEMATCFLSTASNCCAAPLNPSYTESEFKFYLDDLKPKALIVSENSVSPVIKLSIKKGIKIFRLIASNENKLGKFSLKSDSQNKVNYKYKKNKIFPDDIALVLHTSGTTSKPKMVPLTHLNLCSSAKNIVGTLKLARTDRCINIMPLFHIHGIVGLLLSSLFSGGSIFPSRRFNALKFFGWLDEISPTWFSAVPTMHQAILIRASKNKKIISRTKLRFVRSSSAPLSSKTMMEIENIFKCPLIESYGMTEASHQMTSNHLPPGKRKALKAGFAAGPELAILENNNIIFKNNKIGEIIIRGNNVTSGYLNNPKANKDSYYNGWFRTGDLGFFDHNGFLQLTGRIKEIINKGGEKISPIEIDNVIMEHKSVFQAISFSISDKNLGEDIAAAVVLKNDHKLTQQDIKEFLKKKLVPFKIPQKILILKEIPKGKTGKLKRIGLAQKLGLEE